MPSQAAVIAAVAEHGPTTANRLAELKGWNPKYVSRQLGIVFFRGDVERERIDAKHMEYTYRTRIIPEVVSPKTQWRPVLRLPEKLLKPERERV